MRWNFILLNIWHLNVLLKLISNNSRMLLVSLLTTKKLFCIALTSIAQPRKESSTLCMPHLGNPRLLILLLKLKTIIKRCHSGRTNIKILNIPLTKMSSPFNLKGLTSGRPVYSTHLNNNNRWFPHPKWWWWANHISFSRVYSRTTSYHHQYSPVSTHKGHHQVYYPRPNIVNLFILVNKPSLLKLKIKQVYKDVYLTSLMCTGCLIMRALHHNNKWL
jgi:hypothetical protein